MPYQDSDLILAGKLLKPGEARKILDNQISERQLSKALKTEALKAIVLPGSKNRRLIDPKMLHEFALKKGFKIPNALAELVGAPKTFLSENCLMFGIPNELFRFLENTFNISKEIPNLHRFDSAFSAGEYFIKFFPSVTVVHYSVAMLEVTSIPKIVKSLSGETAKVFLLCDTGDTISKDVADAGYDKIYFYPEGIAGLVSDLKTQFLPRP